MSAVLKKSSRRDIRFQFESSYCRVKSLNSAKTSIAQINDMSLGGMSFFLEENPFKEKSVIEIQIPGLKGQSITFLGMVVQIPEPLVDTSPVAFRYSIRFDRRLSEIEFRSLIKSFALIAREA